MIKKIVFITGTRADYGKIKSLIDELEGDPKYEVYIFLNLMIFFYFGDICNTMIFDFGDIYTSMVNFRQYPQYSG